MDAYKTAFSFLSERKRLHLLLHFFLFYSVLHLHRPRETFSSDTFPSGASVLPSSNAVFLCLLSIDLCRVFDTAGIFQLENFSSLNLSEFILGGFLKLLVYSLSLIGFFPSNQPLSLYVSETCYQFQFFFAITPQALRKHRCSQGFNHQLHSSDAQSFLFRPYLLSVLYSAMFFGLPLRFSMWAPHCLLKTKTFSRGLILLYHIHFSQPTQLLRQIILCSSLILSSFSPTTPKWSLSSVNGPF